MSARNTSTAHRKKATDLPLQRRLAAEGGLAHAFLTFTQAAGSLERSYSQLQGEVTRLREELAKTNAELEHSVEENSRVRGFLTQVLENLPCGVVVAGKSVSEIQVLNPEARRLLQVPADWNAAPSCTVPVLLERLLSQAGEGGSLEDEWMKEGKFGKRYVAATQAKLQSDSELKSNSDYLWILRDVTEAKRLGEEREAARKSMALAEIATLLAHEIRNPLGSMELFTGLLADASANSPETRQWVNHLQAGLRSLSATVNNVLQFHAMAVVQLIPTDLGRLLSELSDFLLPLARQRGQQIKYENTIGSVLVPLDANRMKQVILNLALNAFRAMPPGGTLGIRLDWAPQFPGGLARIEVHDEGRGIAPELQERIFEPGFTTTPGSPGLGLAVSRKIVEQHGGQLEVQSRLKDGSRFTIVLPCVGDAA